MAPMTIKLLGFKDFYYPGESVTGNMILNKKAGSCTIVSSDLSLVRSEILKHQVVYHDRDGMTVRT